MKKKRIVINGFGRIGRAAFKIALQKRNLEIVAINDLTLIESLGYLLEYDTVYGRYDQKVGVKGNSLFVGRKEIPVFAQADPSKLPWKKLKVDVVLECTGFFTQKDGAVKHLEAGAKKVIISAPTKSDDLKTAVLGVNEKDILKEKIFSNASCTTNCISPVMAVLQEAFGIEKALMTTIHAYTSTQNIVDGANKDPRRGRAGAQNMIPTSTGAAKATALTIPSLKNKFDGISVRVPVACGSLVDVVCLLKKNITTEQLKKTFIKYSKIPRFKGILEVSDKPLVSVDIIKTNASAIVDLDFLRVVDGNLVKVFAWYDNEWAYSQRLVEMAELID